MTDRSVYWHDGMFMWPHHMQQEERFQAERSRLGHHWNIHHNWGLRLIEMDLDALQSGRLVIHRLRARMHDGTLVEVPEEGRLPSLDLNEILVATEQVTILLAVARLHENRPNAVKVSATQAAGGGPNDQTALDTRYLVEDFEVADENTGEDEQTLSFRTLNLKLFTHTQDSAGYEVLPIARFERSPTAGEPPRLDSNYIPPVLACDAWKPLAVDILQFLFDHVGGRMDNLAKKVLSRGVTFESHNPGDGVLLGQLGVLNEAFAVLNTLAFAEGIHPFTAYLELCRIVGQLAVFIGDHRAPKLPAYDHDDLGSCFYQVKRHLDEVESRDAAYEERRFIGEGLRIKVALEPKWLEPAWQMFVGVQSPLQQSEVIRLLTIAGQLNMKIGSSDSVDQIYERGIRGLEFTHTAQPPRVLPVMAGLTYFQVNRDSQKNEWEKVQKSLTLAIRVNQNRVVVNAQGTLQGLEVLSLKQQGTQAATTMQFSLYLVSGPG